MADCHYRVLNGQIDANTPGGRHRLDVSRRAPAGRPALVNGTAGVVVAAGRRLVAVMSFTVTGDGIVEIDILADPARLRRLHPAALHS